MISALSYYTITDFKARKRYHGFHCRAMKTEDTASVICRNYFTQGGKQKRWLSLVSNDSYCTQLDHCAANLHHILADWAQMTLTHVLHPFSTYKVPNKWRGCSLHMFHLNAFAEMRRGPKRGLWGSKSTRQACSHYFQHLIVQQLQCSKCNL